MGSEEAYDRVEGGCSALASINLTEEAWALRGALDAIRGLTPDEIDIPGEYRREYLSSYNALMPLWRSNFDGGTS